MRKQPAKIYMTQQEIDDLHVYASYPFGPNDIGSSSAERIVELQEAWDRGRALAFRLPQEMAINFRKDQLERFNVALEPKEEDDFRVGLQANIEGITKSAVFCMLYSETMDDFKQDPWPAIQLAIAILADKPIIVACLPGREPPLKLRQIADKVVYGEPEELTDKVAEHMSSLDEK